MGVRVLHGDCRTVLPTLPEQSVQCCVTSPPYFGLRDYGVDGQIGLEATPDAYIAEMVGVFRDVRRVLRDDGVLFLNVGDSYAASQHAPAKPKDLLMIPARLALALQAPFYTGKIKDVADRIWLAAMIDAEGCMFIHKRKAGSDTGSRFTKADGTEMAYLRTQDSYGSGMEVANTSLAIVERCMQITGKGSICTQSPEQNGRRKQTLYRWNLRTNECRDVVREVYPFFVAKKQQARILIGCPASGDRAAAAHAAMIDLHNGKPSDVDFPEPAGMMEPCWYLRSDVIWAKPNCMPESVTDRPTSAHEHVFLLTKRERYFYDAKAISEPVSDTPGAQAWRRVFDPKKQSKEAAQKTQGVKGGNDGARDPNATERNARNVWTIATQPYSGAHFATMPPALAERCVKAGSRIGDTVLDPFGGAGTTGLVADRLQRNGLLIELNPAYGTLATGRVYDDAPLLMVGA